ncbi:UDP-glycosyltransferase [Actinidia chinensis var. chinensis]|uniref:UDP-glycosyltransferase n=1 Tax=Actinidia chinensis var. chinensis TaxID=1590841 RepID=A0A2R6RWX6_ACTCC|nr:UDP-glycosyltransferase [Actinidia chinensis var. chinensis]
MENHKRETPLKPRRLLLFPIPSQGHINPMLQLANILHSTGAFSSITVIHPHLNSPNPTNHPHFTFLPIPDGLSENEASTRDVVAFLSVLNRNCAGPFRDCLAELLAEEEGVACLITDAWWLFSQAVADGFGLPRIVLRTGSVASFLGFAALPLLREKGYLPKQDSQLEEPVPELPPLKVKDLPTVTTHNSENFYNLVAAMVKETKSSAGLIWNSFEDLEQSPLTKFRQEFPIPNFSIGPFHKYFSASSTSLLAHDTSSIPWLDTQPPKSVLYVSFGSVVEMGGNEFQEIAWGLADSLQPFLWVVRPGLVRGSKWLEILPNGFMEAIHGRGHIVKWAPQQEVLAHRAVGGFWTHNGWNSTLESICEGVPMICYPCFGDQMGNARYVTDVWRIGIGFESGMERGLMARTIRRLMVEREGEEMRERIMCLKEKAGVSQQEGGSSHHYLESLITYILSF